MAVLPQMRLLINLARIDGQVAELEKNYIINIGKANNLKPDEIEPLFKQHHELVIPDRLSDDEKFNYIFSLVQLMKIDQRMYKEEILFCAKIASRLGYDQEVLFDLMLHVRGVMETTEMDALKELTTRYLRKIG